MADINQRKRAYSMLPPPRSYPTPRSQPSYPDTWESRNDSYHRERVELFKRRRESVSSNGGSRPTTPSTPRSVSTITSEYVDVSSPKWRTNTPWARDRLASLSQSSDAGTSDICMSPIELRDELDRYDRESQFLTKKEWVTPPTSRGRIRRMDPKLFNIEKIKTFKRWNGVQGFMYGLNSSMLRDTDIRQPPEAYDSGVIFSAPFHTPANSEEINISNDDPNLTATAFGTVNSKYRKMIVLRVFGEHVQCLPIYTHNGRGLEGKEFVREYVSIRDVKDRDPAADEGPHRGLRACRDSEYRETFVSGRSVVKLTEVYSHRYESPATIEGRLDIASDSKRRLFDLVRLVTL
ncbi:hypothetical protein F5Y13DRAFT_202316 [Hypoxylon sp. FL1857]|nr:hypothetical protein F5Y13DRAFT_202316 [Hypoxylon sp. FL1857]